VLAQTTNEKINHSRYSWMVNEQGQLCNRFVRMNLFCCGLAVIDSHCCVAIGLTVGRWQICWSFSKCPGIVSIIERYLRSLRSASQILSRTITTQRRILLPPAVNNIITIIKPPILTQPQFHRLDKYRTEYATKIWLAGTNISFLVKYRYWAWGIDGNLVLPNPKFCCYQFLGHEVSI
jgi:hypothetical protein